MNRVLRDRAALRRRARELGVFAGVGSVALVVQLGLLNLFLAEGLDPLAANGAALVASTTVAFLGNRYLTFRRRSGRRMRVEALAFIAVNLVTFAVAELLLASSYLVGAQHDRMVLNVLTLAGVAVGTVLRFAGYRRFVFPGNRAVPAQSSA